VVFLCRRINLYLCTQNSRYFESFIPSIPPVDLMVSIPLCVNSHTDTRCSVRHNTFIGSPLAATYVVNTSSVKRLSTFTKNLLLSGAFAKLRKTTISFVMSVCLSVCPHETTGLPMDGFLLNSIYKLFFENLSRKFKFHFSTFLTMSR
jgi:hypothetical protein